MVNFPIQKLRPVKDFIFYEDLLCFKSTSEPCNQGQNCNLKKKKNFNHIIEICASRGHVDVITHLW